MSNKCTHQASKAAKEITEATGIKLRNVQCINNTLRDCDQCMRKKKRAVPLGGTVVPSIPCIYEGLDLI